jgi:hypothetical protein
MFFCTQSDRFLVQEALRVQGCGARIHDAHRLTGVEEGKDMRGWADFWEDKLSGRWTGMLSTRMSVWARRQSFSHRRYVDFGSPSGLRPGDIAAPVTNSNTRF